MKKFLIGVIVLIIGIAVFANIGDDGEIPRDNISTSSQVVESQNTEKPQNVEDGFYCVGDYGVKINEMKIVEDSISKCVIVTYEFKNVSKNPQSFNFAFSAHAYQNGVELDKPNLWHIDVLDDFNDNAGTNIKDGASIEVDEAYRLIDDISEVEIEVGNTILGLAGEEPLTQTFSIVQ